ncbi:copper resistance CopC/CopD family protein [Microbacterium sp. M]|uniref:copper resistance CopC/CopD family protein n=1 Tax=Microbacterium sp. M TaxID=3377125 RepID=UPI00386FC49C
MSILIAGKQRPRRGTRGLLRAAAAILLGGMLVLVGAQSASAHAELLSTTPEDGAVLEEAPAEGVLSFNEPVQLIDGSIRLFPGDEDPITLDAHVSNTNVVAEFPSGLDDGRFALSYRVVSADGHPITGAITFTIGDSGGVTPTPVIDTQTPKETTFALSALTALQYLALLVFTGLLFFDRLVLRNTQPITARTAVFLRWTGIGAVVASLLLIPVSALNVTGESLARLTVPSAWWPGLLWAPGTAAALVLAGVAGAYTLALRDLTLRYRQLFALAFPLLALAAPVLVGHSQLVEPQALIMISDYGHLLAGSFWAGGVLGLLLFLVEAWPARGDAAGTDPKFAANVVRRFSRFAVWSVIILAISGITMGIMIVGDVDTLLTSAYGLTLLLKTSIVIPIIAIAAYNRLRLLPSLTTRPTAPMRWRFLTRTLSYEAALLVTVLAVTGFLTNLSPGHDHHTETAAPAAIAETARISADSQELTVEGTLEPALTGDNDIAFTLRYEDEPVAPEEVTLRISLPEHDLGPFQVVPDLDAETGEYTARLALPVAGEWQIQVIARVSTFTEPIVSIPITIG